MYHLPEENMRFSIYNSALLYTS